MKLFALFIFGIFAALSIAIPAPQSDTYEIIKPKVECGNITFVDESSMDIYKSYCQTTPKPFRAIQMNEEECACLTFSDLKCHNGISINFHNSNYTWTPQNRDGWSWWCSEY